MNKLKQLGINILTALIFFIISLFVMTMLSYFNIINKTILNIGLFLTIILPIMLCSYKQGRKVSNKGYLEGLKVGFIFILLLVLINLILNGTFDLKNLIYYLIIIVSSTFSSMLGISKKEE